MKKLLITLMLISPFSFADWGDVYYCQMTGHITLDTEGAITNWRLDKFQFKLDSTEKAMVFGKGGFFADFKMTLDQNRVWERTEDWVARGNHDVIRFDKGKLMYSSARSTGIISISADCDKF